MFARVYLVEELVRLVFSLMIGLTHNDDSADASCMVSMVLVLWEVAAILGNGCGIQGQNYVAWLQGSKTPVGFHYNFTSNFHKKDVRKKLMVAPFVYKGNIRTYWSLIVK